MSKPTLDELLRETLADDLPADVERRLQGTVTAFLAIREAARHRGASVPWQLWPLPSGALATVSLLLACAGFIVHLSLGPSAFAGSLARVSAAVSVAAELDRVAAGGWRAVVEAPAAGASEISIEWPAPGEAVARTRDRAGRAVTLRVLRGTMTLAVGGLQDRRLASVAELAATPFAPVSELLSPGRLAERAYRAWTPLRIEPVSDGRALLFVFRDGAADRTYEVTASAGTLQPRTIRRLGPPRSGSGPRAVELVVRLDGPPAAVAAPGNNGDR